MKIRAGFSLALSVPAADTHASGARCSPLPYGSGTVAEYVAAERTKGGADHDRHHLEEQSNPAARGSGRNPITLALILDLDLGMANGIRHGLGALVALPAQRDLLLDTSLLGDDCFFDMLLRLDRAIGERLLVYAQGAVDGTAFDFDAILTQIYLLRDWFLNHIRPDAYAAKIDVALANPQLLLHDGNHLLVTNGP